MRLVARGGDVDIILGKARRRWSVEEKRALVAETFLPGSSVNGVARRHEINTNMLFSWRKRFRTKLGFAKEPDCASFAAVAIAAPETSVATNALPRGETRIEVAFAGGARMTVTGAADPALVKAVTKALARR
jgi:transposase